jgi:outer membrane protein TolC
MGLLLLAPSPALAQAPAPAPAPAPPPALSPSSLTTPPPGTPRVSFVDAVKRSLDRNPTALSAIADIRRSQALVREARAGWFPTLVGTGTYTRLDSDRTLGNGTVIAGANSFNANALLTVPIINPKAWSLQTHAEDQVEVSRVSLAEVRRQLALAVGRAYLTVIAQKRLVEVSERARDTAKAHYDYAKKRFEGGVGNRLDYVRASQQLASAESQLHQARSGLVRAREALGVLVGVEGPVDSGDDPAMSEMPSLNVALDASQKRTDVVAQKSRLAAAQRVLDDNWRDYSPYLSALGQTWYQNPASLTVPVTGWQAQLVLTIPIYDGGLRYGQAKEREALRDQAHLQLEATLRQAKSDVRAAFDAMRLADDSLKSARDASQLAGEALKLAELAYTAGATTNIEVIDAERQARDADSQAAIAEDAARQARLELLVAAGRFP